MSAELTIRPFTEQDSIQVRELFVAVNRLFSPPDRRAAFEAYIERSLSEEIDRISDYYSDRNGGFWVAVRSDKVIGFFGLERVSGDAMELRRMYVDPSARRQGIARRMLQFAENQARCRKASRLELSTSELQDAALALYRGEKYTLVREENVDTPSNKTIGSGIRRYYFEKALSRKCSPKSPCDPHDQKIDHAGVSYGATTAQSLML